MHLYYGPFVWTQTWHSGLSVSRVSGGKHTTSLEPYTRNGSQPWWFFFVFVFRQRYGLRVTVRILLSFFIYLSFSFSIYVSICLSWSLPHISSFFLPLKCEQTEFVGWDSDLLGWDINGLWSHYSLARSLLCSHRVVRLTLSNSSHRNKKSWAATDLPWSMGPPSGLGNGKIIKRMYSIAPANKEGQWALTIHTKATVMSEQDWQQWKRSSLGQVLS